MLVCSADNWKGHHLIKNLVTPKEHVCAHCMLYIAKSRGHSAEYSSGGLEQELEACHHCAKSPAAIRIVRQSPPSQKSDRKLLL